jgi:hypothetical protein
MGRRRSGLKGNLQPEPENERATRLRGFFVSDFCLCLFVFLCLYRSGFPNEEKRQRKMRAYFISSICRARLMARLSRRW